MSAGPRVAVLGAGGRMGTVACAAIEAADDLDLVARIHRDSDAEAAAALAVAAEADVAVELSVVDGSVARVSSLVAAGVSVVVGTSGWGASAVEDVYAQLTDPATPEGVGVLVAPNFALGAVLLMRFAAQAAPYFASVEIVEAHHPDKRDAPSGTAVRTAELVADARARAHVPPSPDATSHAAPGARGARLGGEHGVPVHSVRLRGVTATEEVLLGNPGEVLTLRHETPDLAAYMPGLLLAVRGVRQRPGLVVGLENYLDLD